MKKKIFLAFLSAILLVFLSISCKSAPKADAPAEPPAPVAESGGPSQAAIAALNQAKARADEARKRAADFESPSYFPSDWETAESQYTAAGNLPKTTEAETRRAADSYNAVADAYDGLFNKTIPLYAQAREDEIMAARSGLIATGLTGTFPEYLADADKTTLQALGEYEAKDYYTARDTAAIALGKYQAMKTGADAWLVRQEIIGREFVPYDPDNFDRADVSGLAAVNDYGEGNLEAARGNAEEALLRYNLVLATGWASYAADRGALAHEERQKAVDIKANIAVRDSFNDADALYKQASAALTAEQYEAAANLYIESEARFIMTSQVAIEKRRLAEDAIKEAEEKIEESDETAKQAEIIIEGGSR